MNKILENMCSALNISYSYVNDYSGKGKIVYGIFLGTDKCLAIGKGSVYRAKAAVGLASEKHNKSLLIANCRKAFAGEEEYFVVFKGSDREDIRDLESRIHEYLATEYRNENIGDKNHTFLPIIHCVRLSNKETMKLASLKNGHSKELYDFCQDFSSNSDFIFYINKFKPYLKEEFYIEFMEHFGNIHRFQG